ncbi:hypothetical protein FOPE_10630 [Fonsecaea pedrosoi]|nr:hypothetical protein FOPE_10630 [Fonsecaea pedrosoi]
MSDTTDSETVVSADGDSNEVVTMDDTEARRENLVFSTTSRARAPAFNEWSDQDQQIIRWAITPNSVVVKDITYYVYCRRMASWWQMESRLPTASQELSDVAGINAPPVNYAAALRRLPPVTHHQGGFPGHAPDPGVCALGRTGSFTLLARTLSLRHFRSSLRLKTPSPVAPLCPSLRIPVNSGPLLDIFLMFTVRSESGGADLGVQAAQDRDRPREGGTSTGGFLNNIFFLLLRDDQKLDFMWRIGNALTDPAMNPCVIIFLRPERPGEQ